MKILLTIEDKTKLDSSAIKKIYEGIYGDLYTGTNLKDFTKLIVANKYSNNYIYIYNKLQSIVELQDTEDIKSELLSFINSILKNGIDKDSLFYIILSSEIYLSILNLPEIIIEDNINTIINNYFPLEHYCLFSGNELIDLEVEIEQA